MPEHPPANTPHQSHHGANRSKAARDWLLANWSDIFDAMPDHIALIDADFNILRMNPAMARAFDAGHLAAKPGHAPEPCRHIICKENPVPQDCPHALAMAQGRPQTRLMREPRYPGKHLLTVTPLHMPAAEGFDPTLPVGAVHLARDVSVSQDLEEALRDEERMCRAMFENAHFGIVRLDAEGRVQSANEAAVTMLGYHGLDDILAEEDLLAALFMADPEELRRLLQDLRGGGVQRQERQVLTRDGDLLWVSFTAKPVLEKDPTGLEPARRAYTLLYFEDITESKRDQWMLQEAEEKYRSIFENSVEGIFQVTPRGRFVSGNPALARILGFDTFNELAKAVGEMGGEVFHDQERRLEFIREMNARDGVQDFEALFTKKGGSLVWVSLSARTERDVNGVPVLFEGTIQDITERKAAESKLVYQASHDTLTGLTNRAMFLSHLDKAIKRAQRRDRHDFALLFMDLDRFKVINDSLGHSVGDELLKAMGERLVTCLREEDIFARLGGDEFAALLPDCAGSVDAIRVAQRIEEALERPFRISGHEVFSGASIGIVMAKASYETPEQLLRDADTAMYRAKKDERRRYAVFDEDMHQKAIRRLVVETNLRRALDRGEFRLFYQPIVRLPEGAIGGFEALVRWERPVEGMIGPGEFVPVLEETGLIVPVGEWILGEACRQLAAWRAAFPALDLTMAVNISGKQLFTPALDSQVRQVLGGHGLPPEALKLEITESVLMERAGLAKEILFKMADQGVRLSIDDFGTGYSSLAYLHDFPADVLKIDKSFVMRMDREASGQIVTAIVSLAHTLGKQVVAEGVETVGHLDALSRLACEFVQGYYFSKPVPPAEAEDLLRKGFGD